MWWTASAAPMASVIDTGRPAARSSPTNPVRTSSTWGPSSSARSVRSGGRLCGHRELLGGSLEVASVLEQDVQRRLGLLGVHGLDTEHDQGAGPVERLRHRWVLLELEGAERAHDAGHLVGELVRDPGDPGAHDLALALKGGIVEVEVQAPALQGLGQL